MNHNYIRYYVFLFLLLVTGINSTGFAISKLSQFDKAPQLVLPKLASPDQNFDLQKFGRPAVLVFGELYHKQTLESLAELKKLYDALNITEADVNVFLIISQTPTREQTAQFGSKRKIAAEVLLDKNLKAFDDYGVIVLPSVVVTDREGKIAVALSGVPFSFVDTVEQAILFAVGRINRQQFETSGSALTPADSQPENIKRSHRLTALAGQLLQRNYTQLAIERYREALELDATNPQPKIGLARCFIKLNLLGEAMEQLNKALDADPNGAEANLLIAQVEILQGKESIPDAKLRLQRFLTLRPDHPRANYLMGMIYEMAGETEHALNYYKKAAAGLLDTANY